MINHDKAHSGGFSVLGTGHAVVWRCMGCNEKRSDTGGSRGAGALKRCSVCAAKATAAKTRVRGGPSTPAVLEFLQRSPKLWTMLDLAAELGMTTHIVSASLTLLRKTGFLANAYIGRDRMWGVPAAVRAAKEADTVATRARNKLRDAARMRERGGRRMAVLAAASEAQSGVVVNPRWAEPDDEHGTPFVHKLVPAGAWKAEPVTAANSVFSLGAAA